MKKYILSFITILLFSSYSFSQVTDSIPMIDGKIVYSEVVKVDSATKDELYSRARNFFAHEYKSSKAVMQVDDAAGGQLVGKGIFEVIVKVMGINVDIKISHIITILVKDGKYKMQISDLTEIVEPSTYTLYKEIPLEKRHDKIGKKILIGTNSECKNIMSDLKKAMSTSLTSDF